MALAVAIAWGMAGPNVFDLQARWPYRRRHSYLIAAALGACLALMAGGGSSPFLYFQF